MSQAPPPYPGNEQKGYPPPQNPAYPPPMQGFGSPPPPGQGYAPPPPPNYNTGYGQPSAPGYAPYNPPPPQYGGPQATTVVVQPAYTTVVQHFRESPVHTRCPHCQAEIMTATHYETGTLSWIICLILCFVGCSAGCCLIPFCVDGCKDVVHSCPNCRQHISRWEQQGYGAPPPYGQPQQGYTGNTTVVVAQPTVSVIQQFREVPVHTQCPHCRADVITATEYETGTLTWIICLVLCFVGCDLGCCFIPFCVDGCKDVIHTCPNCRQTISRYSRM